MPDSVKLGCPVWWMPAWKDLLCRPSSSKGLGTYSQWFESVEGNTTFYATPNVDTQIKWRDAVSEDFRFVFKVPRAITHSPSPDLNELKAFALMIERFEKKVGLVQIQLPPAFSIQNMHHLHNILRRLPQHVEKAIEVRHPTFFQKGQIEQDFNRWLSDSGFNRVMFDTRGLFKECAQDAPSLDAMRKKPNLPLHVVATSSRPMVRFIGFQNYEDNLGYLTQWANKLADWVKEGRQPYFFMHTADNEKTPLFALKFKALLEEKGISMTSSSCTHPEDSLIATPQQSLF